MIECMAQPNKTRLECAQIKCLERQRFEKFLDLSDRLERRIVSDGFTDKPTADSVNRTLRKFQNRPPSGLERHSSSGLGKDRIEAADSRLGASSGEPLDEGRETVEPWLECKDPDELENAAECRQSQHAVGIINSGTHPAAGPRERSKQHYPDNSDCNIVDDVRECCSPHRHP